MQERLNQYRPILAVLIAAGALLAAVTSRYDLTVFYICIGAWVLLAIGCPHEIAHGSLRLSLSEETTMADADFVVDQLKEIIPRLRSMSPLYADFIAKK